MFNLMHYSTSQNKDRGRHRIHEAYVDYPAWSTFTFNELEITMLL